MWSHHGGHIDWNPHHFLYPSLTLYLHLLLQRAHALVGTWTGAFHGPVDYLLAVGLDPSPMVLLARALDVAADAVSVWLTFRIGERIQPGVGAIGALLAALSPILITTSSAIFTDPVMLALSLAALDRMQVHRGSTQPWAMAVWTGLAIGAKYPALVLLAPLAWTLFAAHGVRGGLSRFALALGVAVFVFLLTSPYVLIDRATFLRDVGFGRVLASEGLLGATSGPSGGHTLGALARDLGPVASALALGGARAGARPTARSGTDPRGDHRARIPGARTHLAAPLRALPARRDPARVRARGAGRAVGGVARPGSGRVSRCSPCSSLAATLPVAATRVGHGAHGGHDHRGAGATLDRGAHLAR
jgi:hypothetical protein